MKNFAFGLTTGLVVGALATFVAELLLIVAVEDSPETRKLFEENIDKYQK